MCDEISKTKLECNVFSLQQQINDFIKGTCDIIVNSKFYASMCTVVLHLSIIQDSCDFYFPCGSNTTLTLIPLLVLLYSEML